MNKIAIFTLTLCLSTALASAQSSLIGIHNSPRKGMTHVAVNPAEINHLRRSVEVNLFAGGTTVSNNALSFQDILKEKGELIDLALDRMGTPINVSAEMQLLGPSVGFSQGDWSFGFMSQAFAKGDIINLNPDIANALNGDPFFNSLNQTHMIDASKQKVNVSGWTELGFTAGRELYTVGSHIFTAGATFKLLIPMAYLNMGVTDLRGTLIQNGTDVILTDANGELYLSYPRDLEEGDIATYMTDRFSLGNITGTAFDLGIAHQWYAEGNMRVLSGISVRNIGGMRLGSEQSTHRYSINIPQGESFRLDLLDGDLEEIEDQLLNSGYFTRSNIREKSRAGLPPLLSAYADVQFTRKFQVSVFSQFRIADKTDHEQLMAQHVFAITPRVNFGLLEVYSPWTQYEVAGLTGGLGLRIGGFFVGSQSLLTGLLADTKQADVHIGFSMGFGEKNY
ncbi:MAG TPA: DUF5723 family protein [Cyclobacteriaceae bacterium]|nr:DUF5723 family protein [Cyclobacteriaceae bacterium]